jgi:hypothetical protein
MERARLSTLEQVISAGRVRRPAQTPVPAQPPRDERRSLPYPFFIYLLRRLMGKDRGIAFVRKMNKQAHAAADAQDAQPTPDPPQRITKQMLLQDNAPLWVQRTEIGTGLGVEWVLDNFLSLPAPLNDALRRAAASIGERWPPDPADGLLHAFAAFTTIRDAVTAGQRARGGSAWRRQIVLALDEADRLAFGATVLDLAQRAVAPNLLEPLAEELAFVAGLHDNAFPGLLSEFASACLLPNYRGTHLYREGDAETARVLASHAEQFAALGIGDPRREWFGGAQMSLRDLRRAKPELMGPPDSDRADAAPPFDRAYYQTGFVIVERDDPAEQADEHPSPIRMLAPRDRDTPPGCTGWLCDLDLTDPRMVFLGLRGERLRVPLFSHGEFGFFRVDADGTARWLEGHEHHEGDLDGFIRRNDPDLSPDDADPTLGEIDCYYLDRPLANPREPLVVPGILSHIGGEPDWVQEESLPDCPACGRCMRFFLKFHWSWPTYYLFVCPECMILASLAQVD